MKILKSHEFTRSIGARVHDWNTLLDGQIRQLDESDFGEGSAKTMRMMLYKQAQVRGKTVKVERTEDSGLIVQAFPMTKEQLAERDTKFAARKAKVEAKKAAEKNGQPTATAPKAKAPAKAK